MLYRPPNIRDEASNLTVISIERNEIMRMPQLTELLVIDLIHVLNGPFGTTILTDLGARVIKIEPPGHGDDTRTYGPFYKDQSLYFSFINRGKESIVLN